MLVLGRKELERLLTPLKTIGAMERAFRQYALGEATLLPRQAMKVTKGGILLVMPVALRSPSSEAGSGALGVKLVTVYEENRDRGLPTLHASYLLFDHETGAPLALIEGSFLTGMRTGATSAVAARALARPDSHTVACFGAGVQAEFQLRCLAAVLPLKRVLVTGRSQERALSFTKAMEARLGITVEIAGDPSHAVSQADVITCATTSPAPVFNGKDITPGTHIDAVGAFRPETREVDTETVTRAHVAVDSYAGAWKEAGDLLIPLKEGAIGKEHVRAELAELVTGTKPGRTNRQEITLFKSVGLALEDVSAARLAYDEARAAGVGVEVDLE